MHGGTNSIGRSWTLAVSGLYSISWNSSFSNTTAPSVVATLRPTSNTLSSVCDTWPLLQVAPAAAACPGRCSRPWCRAPCCCASGLSARKLLGAHGVDPLLHAQSGCARCLGVAFDRIGHLHQRARVQQVHLRGVGRRRVGGPLVGREALVGAAGPQVPPSRARRSGARSVWFHSAVACFEVVASAAGSPRAPAGSGRRTTSRTCQRHCPLHARSSAAGSGAGRPACASALLCGRSLVVAHAALRRVARFSRTPSPCGLSTMAWVCTGLKVSASTSWFSLRSIAIRIANMLIVAIGMAVRGADDGRRARRSAPGGTVLGALFTFVLYGVLPLAIVLYIMRHADARRARAARPQRVSGGSRRRRPCAR